MTNTLETPYPNSTSIPPCKCIIVEREICVAGSKDTLRDAFRLAKAGHGPVKNFKKEPLNHKP